MGVVVFPAAAGSTFTGLPNNLTLQQTITSSTTSFAAGAGINFVYAVVAGGGGSGGGGVQTNEPGMAGSSGGVAFGITPVFATVRVGAAASGSAFGSITASGANSSTGGINTGTRGTPGSPGGTIRGGSGAAAAGGPSASEGSAGGNSTFGYNGGAAGNANTGTAASGGGAGIAGNGGNGNATNTANSTGNGGAGGTGGGGGGGGSTTLNSSGSGGNGGAGAILVYY